KAFYYITLQYASAACKRHVRSNSRWRFLQRPPPATYKLVEANIAIVVQEFKVEIAALRLQHRLRRSVFAGKPAQHLQMLHGEQLTIYERQRAALAERLESFRRQRVQRSFVDAEQPLYRLLAAFGFDLDIPGLNQVVLRQQGAQTRGDLRIARHLIQKIQHVLHGLGRVTFLVEERFAFALHLGDQSAFFANAQHALAIFCIGEHEWVTTVRRRHVRADPAAIGCYEQILSGSQALPGHQVEAVLRLHETDEQRETRTRQFLGDERSNGLGSGERVRGITLPALVSVIFPRNDGQFCHESPMLRPACRRYSVH